MSTQLQTWDFLPISMNLQGRECLVVGDTEQAVRKTDLLLRAGAKVRLLGDANAKALVESADVLNAITLTSESFHSELLQSCAMVVAASDSTDLNQQVAQAAQARGVPVNVVEQPELSSFIFPSIIDRHPVLVSVTSSGGAPVLTRLLRNRLESLIPHGFGRLADLAMEFRDKVRARFGHINQRRRFWESVLEGVVSDLVFCGRTDKARAMLDDMLSGEQADTITGAGEVYLVGAGPGDPDLLTFRALRLMRQADVVLYDRLVSPQILDLVRRDAKRINVGKARSNHTLPQQEINAMLVELAKEGKRVLRLKGGDPFIFGRGGEEIDQLADAGIPFQVVPGITAASGCAAYSGIPLTHRDHSQSVRFVTGHLKSDTCDLPWHEFVQDNQTLVFYMGLVGLPVISRELIAHGMKPSTPIALVSRGTLPDQQVLVGELGNIAKKVEEQQIPGPTIIIIGDVVTLRDRLRWMD
ncbi:siroheme synthase CysG [Hahella sp. NBU794]|uniref:siroheme synthase CysG n=1 Tax=Hahella sp. NBU794 TaxID=3422590 RepID=UPI003D6EB34E